MNYRTTQEMAGEVGPISSLPVFTINFRGGGVPALFRLRRRTSQALSLRIEGVGRRVALCVAVQGNTWLAVTVL